MKNIYQKIIFITILFLGIFILNPLQTKAMGQVNGEIQVFWYDYSNYYGQRPKELEIPIKDYNSAIPEEKTLVVKEDEATVKKVDEYLTIWTFNVDFTSFSQDDPAFNFAASKFNMPSGYEYDPVATGGQLTYDGGLIKITFFKNVDRKLKVTFNFDDDQGRDFSRYFDIDLKAKNYPSLKYELSYTPYDFKNKDTFVFDDLIVRGVLNDDPTSDDWMKPIIYEATDRSNLLNVTKNYIFDDKGNLIVNVKKEADKISVPIKILWLDEENKENKRPTSLKIKAINQNDEIEKKLEINSKDDWNKTIELFKNMKYSQGTTQNIYSLEVESVENYALEVTGDSSGFTITGKYIEKEEIIQDEKDDNNDKPIDTEITENPSTYDEIFKYVLVGFLSIITLGFSIKKVVTK